MLGAKIELVDRALERAAHLRARLVAVVGLLHQRLGEDFLDRRRERDVEGGQRVGAHQPLHDVEIVLGVIRRVADEQLVETHPRGPDVRAMVGPFRRDLLGGHVADLALHDALTGLSGASVLRLHEAEVDHLRGALGGDEDVLRRDVPVDDAEALALGVLELVRRVEAGAGLGHDPQRDARRERGAALEREAVDLREGVAVDVLHHEVEDVVLLAELEDLRDVRMDDPRGDARLVEEHLLEVRFGDELGLDRLDREQLLEAALAAKARKPDARHAARRDRAEQLVAIEPIAWDERALRGFHGTVASYCEDGPPSLAAAARPRHANGSRREQTRAWELRTSKGGKAGSWDERFPPSGIVCFGAAEIGRRPRQSCLARPALAFSEMSTRRSRRQPSSSLPSASSSPREVFAILSGSTPSFAR